MRAGIFISSTGTSAGKTFLARGLARAQVELGFKVAGIKPLETGCQPHPLDALALAAACSEPELANAAGLYRVEPPVSPYAATLLGQQPPDFDALVSRVRAISEHSERVIVEGAGGLLVPLDQERDTSDLIRALGYPVVLVAPNRLGVLSHVLALGAVARMRGIDLAAIVLSEPDATPDASSSTNAAVLETRLSIPILAFPHRADDVSDLAAAVRQSGLLEALGWHHAR